MLNNDQIPYARVVVDIL